MNTIQRYLKTSVLIVLSALMPSFLSSQGMVEIMADFGDSPNGYLYPGPDGNAVPQIWPSGDVTDEPLVDIDGIPEGRKAKHVILKSDSSWKIAFQNPVNLKEFEGGYARFWLRSANESPVFVILQDGDPTIIPLQGTIWKTKKNWQEYQMALPTKNKNYTSVTYGWRAHSSVTDVDFEVDHIRWMKQPATIKVFPESVRVKRGKRRQFSVQAYDITGSTISISALFTLSPSLGTLSHAPSQQTYYSILQAGGVGSGQVNIQDLIDKKLVASANVEITDDNLDQEFGLLSDLSSLSAILGGENVNSRLDFFYKDLNEAYKPQLEEITSDVMEGNKALKTTLTLRASSPTDIPWAGWTIRWGNELPENLNDSNHTNMSDYYDGAIRFWFKGPPGLKDLLKVSIRSGNVPGGFEVSKDLLSRFGVPFDNEWQPVVIPLDQWAKSRPFADLSRMKNFFTVSVAGDIGEQSFYIDNLRWDTRKPEGPINRIEIRPKEFREGEKLLVPLRTRRTFRVYAYDVYETTVDVKPQWVFTDKLGKFTESGNKLMLEASDEPAEGTIKAIVNGKEAIVNVIVQKISPTATFDVYTDNGIPVSSIGISTGPELTDPDASKMIFNQVSYAGVPETPPEALVSDGVRFMRSDLTLVSSKPGKNDAWSVWFIADQADGRFLKDYDQGFLRFWVRTPVDLEVSIAPVIEKTDPIENRAKIQLGEELGIPINNKWQEVVIALDEFKAREPRLKDYSDVRTFFAIGTTSKVAKGDPKNVVFDVDNVQWLSVNSRVITDEKIYRGLVEKRLVNNGVSGMGKGLLRSYGMAKDESLSAIYTMDQALAAMTFIYWSGHAEYSADIQFAKDIFDFYKAQSESGVFSGFANAYDAKPPHSILVNDTHPQRFSNPNAFMLLALIHYKNATKDGAYDTLIEKLATWLYSTRAADDGALVFPPSFDIENGTKFSAYNMVAYAAFNAYSKIKPSTDPNNYVVAADKISLWLKNEMYDFGGRRFYDAEKPSGSIWENHALNNQSFSTLIFGQQYEDGVKSSLSWFGATSDISNTGATMNGFDFGSLACTESGKTVDKDTVWIEGTAQMVLAFKSTGNAEVGNAYLDEIMKSVFELSDSAQGIPMAAKPGTPYGYFCPASSEDPVPLMNARDAAVSSMVWYLFARHGFNPFLAVEYFSAVTKSISTNLPVAEITWNRNITSTLREWDLATSYVEISAHALRRRNFFVTIYTHNTNPAHETRFVDPTPPGPKPTVGEPNYAELMRQYEYNSSNPDSNPAGLLLVNATPFGYTGPAIPNFKESSVTIPLAWTIRDRRQTILQLRVADPADAVKNPENKAAPLWFYIKDLNTPFIDPDPSVDGDEIPPFGDSGAYVRMYEGHLTLSSNESSQYHLAHVVQADPKGQIPTAAQGFYPSYGYDYLYFESLLTNVVTPAVYYSPIYIDFMSE